ncbi:hypothetical protein [Methyloferula stellata]|uniref:hypothetical protein n=1 Tax=Methyloferula stellata TaxID=876270 RepID=UPI0003669599|nr:hypothetical protein [Methyloferula stellata]
MADDVTIRFTADISDLQSGIQQANSAIQSGSTTLRGGAAQVSSAFDSLGQAFSNSLTQRANAARASGDEVLAIARVNAREQYDIALNGVKEQESSVREQAQTSQISHEQELTSLLALEQQREEIETRYLTAVRATYEQGTSAFADAQRKIEELESQSALRRQQIETSVNREIYNDYRRTFDQVGSSISNSIMQMIRGHQTLQQAVQNVALSIVQSFIQARIRMVADWLAGQATKVAATHAAEAAETAATTAGVTARTSVEGAGAAAAQTANFSSMISQILASSKEAFAGIFGFLSPLMGPAAAGPAAAGEATVAAMASFDTGAWQLPSDMIAQVHQGEMIVPAAQTPWAQSLMANAVGGGGSSSVTVNHATHFNISALDSGDVKRWIRGNGKEILRTINEGVRLGTHLGLKKLQA